MKVDPGWYLDPTGAFHGRFWDGEHWTDRVVDDFGVESVPSLAPTGPRLDVAAPDRLENSEHVQSDSPDASDVPSAEAPERSTAASDADRLPSTDIGEFGAAVTGATTLESESEGEATRHSRRRRKRRRTVSEELDANATQPVDLANRDQRPGDVMGSADARVLAARSLGHAAIALSAVAIVAAVVPLLGPVSVVLGLTAFAFALIARRRLVRSSVTPSRTSFGVIGFAVLAALGGAVATAVLVITFVAGDVAELSACVAFDGAPTRCVAEFSRDSWMTLR